ncbi:MAG: hypothetical protein H6Q10_2723, partial [Acidobacteria bacterium]|nr:hypothetical protein [Acidobacteriota bacterium]
IAALLGIPTGTAKWRAMEGRRLLRDRFRRRAEGEGRDDGTRRAEGGRNGRHEAENDEAG